MRTVPALFLGAFFLLFLGVSQSSAANCYAVPGNLVANCGFELGTFAGWTLTGNDVPGELNNLYGVEGVDPIDGIGPASGSYQAFFADLVSNATTLSQTVATTAGSQYKITFNLAQDTTATSNYPNELLVSFAGASVFSQTDVPEEGYTQYTLTGTATSASSVLAITLGNDLGESLVDNITVTYVPEPSTVTLMLGSCALAAGILRRRRAA